MHLLGYIGDKKNLRLKYHSKIEDATIYGLLRQARINSENQLMLFSYSILQDCIYTARSIGWYIVFYQGGIIYHCTHVPVPVDQYSAENEYNSVCTAVLAPAHFRMINNELINRYPDVVPEQAPLIVLGIKSSACMDNNGEYTKHTIHISRRMNFVRNGEDLNLHKILWCEGGQSSICIHWNQ